MINEINNTTPVASVSINERTLQVPRGYSVGRHVSGTGRSYRYVTRNRDDVSVLCPLTPAQDEVMDMPAMRAALASACDEVAHTFTFATDSDSGTVTADSLREAYRQLRENITDEMIADGATLWVADCHGVRITMGAK